MPQNIALRRQSEELSERKKLDVENSLGDSEFLGGASTKPPPPPVPSTSSVSPGREKSGMPTGKGHILGSTMEDGANADELRTQLKQKWELEKKLERRVKQLEHRLKERMDEIDDLQAQLKKARDAESRATVARDELSKKLATGSKKGDKGSVKATAGAGDVTEEVENYREKVFALEEELQSIRRKSEVEQQSEIMLLRQQVYQFVE